MRRILALIAVVGVAGSAYAQGQQPAPPPKPAPKKVVAGQTVEIRGQAPTPQVVTVRPREVPSYKPSSLPQAVMSSGNWPAISSAYAVAPSALLAGRLPIDTSAAGLARGGGGAGALIAGGTAMAAMAHATGGAAANVAAPGTSAEEIESMRREMAMRRARLDSLEKAQANSHIGSAVAAGAAAASRPRMTAADSAARAAEIAAIRKELQYRKARLDSLQKEVNNLGGKSSSPKKSSKSDTTKSGKPPRGTR